MKNFARFSLAAVALTALIGTAGCSGTAPSSAPVAETKQSASAQADKPVGFTENIPVQGTLPADWSGGAGWRVTTAVTAENVFAVGDYLAYIAGNEYESGPDSALTKPGHLVLVDGKGSIAYKSKDQTDAVPDANSLRTVTKDGATYLVFIEVATVKGKDDPNSLAKAPGTTIQSAITVLDSKGKELYSKKVDQHLYFGPTTGDAITVVGTGNDKTVVDVATGEAKIAPELAGFEWSGTVDGVNIYSSTATASKNIGGMASVTVTDGKWSVTGDIPFSQVGQPTYAKVGPYVSIMTGEQTYKVINPHTGEEVAPLNTGMFAVSSPDGNFLSVDGGVYSVKDKKVYPISNENDFEVDSITNSGDVYGTSNSKKGFVNILSGSVPKALPGATLIPVVVSGSGLAAFSEAPGIDETVFVTKK